MIEFLIGMICGAGGLAAFALHYSRSTRPKAQASTPNWSATSAVSNAIVEGVNGDMLRQVFRNLQEGNA
jgi:hypothetical protein